MAPWKSEGDHLRERDPEVDGLSGREAGECGIDDADDDRGGAIQVNRLSDGVWRAAEESLPVWITENDYGRCGSLFV